MSDIDILAKMFITFACMLLLGTGVFCFIAGVRLTIWLINNV